MRSLALTSVMLAALALGPAALAQAPEDSARVSRVRAELRALVDSANAALRRHDRAALERIYAEEYMWVHSSGYINYRKTHLDEQLSVDSIEPLPIRLTPPEELRVYGDVAVLRRPWRSTGPMWNGRASISTWIFARRGGRWRIVQQQATMLQPERAVAPVAESLLASYAGDYGERGRPIIRVRRDGAGLLWRGVPAMSPPRVMLPVSDTAFFDKQGTEYRFERAPDGRVRALVVHQPDGRVLRRERLP